MSVRRVRLALLLVLFILGVHTGFQTFLNRNQFASTIVNTLCSTVQSPQRMKHLMFVKNNHSDIDHVFKENTNSLFSSDELNNIKRNTRLCKLPDALQFTKFIWLLTDGLPVKYSTKIMNHYKEHAVVYLVDIPGPKYSHAIYSSFVTGQLPTNYQGSPIEGDSIIKAMQRSPDIGPLTYIGPEWSFLAIQGKESYDQLFRRILFRPEPLDNPHDRAYRFFFSDQSSREWLTKILNYIRSEKGSLLTHSAIFDHVNHGVYRNNPSPKALRKLEQVADKTAEDLNSLKEYIDNNPDTLLILSSDHGCDDISNGYVLHGYSTDGNEGYVMLYNPRLQSYKTRVDVVDIAPTIAKYLSKVDIPSDNVGVARTFFGEDEFLTEYHNNILKQNIIQLSDTTHRRGIHVNSENIRNLMNIKNEYMDPKELNNQLVRTATSLKMSLYKFMGRPFGWVVFYGIQSILVLIFIFYRYNHSILQSILEFRVIESIRKIMPLLPMYFGVFINILFIWDGWKSVIRAGSPFFIWHGYLTVIIFYLLIHIIVFSSNDSTRNDLLYINKKFAIHILLDMTWFTLSVMFKKEWKQWVNSKYFFFLPYVGILLLVLLFSGVRASDILSPIMKKGKQFLRFNKSVNDESTNNVSRWKCYIHLFAPLLLFLFVILFEMTSVKTTASKEEKENYIKYYTIFGFHKYYTHFLVSAFLYFLMTAILDSKNLVHLITPVLLYAFTIMRDTPHNRVVLIITTLQYYFLLVPIIQRVTALSCLKFKPLIPTNNEDKNAKDCLDQNQSSYYWSLFSQALILLLINEPMFQFIICKEEKLNVDAHPMAGAVGMRSHQEHPSFNAFQIAFEKWHPLLIFTLFLWIIVYKPQWNRATPDLLKTKGKRNSPDRKHYRRYLTDMLLSIYALLLFNANVFLQLLLCFISITHPFEECIVYLIVVSVVGCTFTVFHILTEYISVGKTVISRITHWLNDDETEFIIPEGHKEM